ncbi:TPA: phage tail protein [Pasteurella multocida]|uniref:Phage minor tail protein G n=3 Tax=Pasteurella multocida TaxID=747 RepID=A0A9X3UVL3_PASMD|nr:phage minor tail protein G [Pasteurella multocida]MCL7774806.1 phage tail protein [Pasteurella multocida]MCL7783529.1 phage tail protein [Pasteurella multocida]MDA5609155.1 phage minor tail protein G [Pasteurella multocida subsp. multocida]MDA5611760.1 phage minor tail protein G [Pasteurella multocida]MDA5614214.1 phage minor tail protein G [Pasteurella multocida]
MLKKVEFTLNGAAIQLSAISALDYLNYVEYMNELDKPENIAESDTEKELHRKLNQANKLNLLVNTRLIAISMSYAEKEKTVDEIQDHLLNNFTHTDILTLLDKVQDVCEFPKVEKSEDDEVESGEQKNV